MSIIPTCIACSPNFQYPFNLNLNFDSRRFLIHKIWMLKIRWFEFKYKFRIFIFPKWGINLYSWKCCRGLFNSTTEMATLVRHIVYENKLLHLVGPFPFGDYNGNPNLPKIDTGFSILKLQPLPPYIFIWSRINH